MSTSSVRLKSSLSVYQNFGQGHPIIRFDSKDTIAEVSGFGLRWRSSCASFTRPRIPTTSQTTLPTSRFSPAPHQRPYPFLHLQLTSPITAYSTSNLSQPSIIIPNTITLTSSSVHYTHQITSRLLYRIPAPARFPSKPLVYINDQFKKSH